jgi:cell cycle checkpoint protein
MAVSTVLLAVGVSLPSILARWSQGILVDRESLISKFSNFLNRASAYGALEFTSASSSAPSPSNKRLILLEDLPNILHTATRDAFHIALEQFVLAPTTTSCPLVIIVSDAGTRGESGGDNGASWRNRVNDAIDARMVLPKHLQNSPYVADITFDISSEVLTTMNNNHSYFYRFNPIAITYLRRAVQLLFSKHFASLASSSGHNRPPSQDFVDSVLESSNGDIRSVLMTLQFATVVDLPNTRKKGEKTKRTAAMCVFLVMALGYERSV